jgi:hypothetical protein
MFQSCKSESTNIGFNQILNNGARQEIIVILGKITSLPLGKSKAANASSKAVDPFETATACPTLISSAKRFSKSVIIGLSPDIHVDFRHSMTQAMSSSEMDGRLTGNSISFIRTQIY